MIKDYWIYALQKCCSNQARKKPNKKPNKQIIIKLCSLVNRNSALRCILCSTCTELKT